MERVEEVDDALAQVVFEVELLALHDLLPALDQVARPLVDVLQEVLRGGLQEQDLVVVVPVVRQVAALLADELVVQAAVRHVVSPVVRAQAQLAGRPGQLLLIRLLLLGEGLAGVDLTRVDCLHLRIFVLLREAPRRSDAARVLVLVHSAANALVVL